MKTIEEIMLTAHQLKSELRERKDALIKADSGFEETEEFELLEEAIEYANQCESALEAI
jgi:hypothetical protein